jgi:hypothetical protein
MSKRSNGTEAETVPRPTEKATTRPVARQVDAADPDLAAEVDFSRGRRGDFLPADPAARAARLEAWVLALQRNGARLRDDYERLQVLLAWAAGMLSEEQAAQRLDVAPPELHAYREAALRAAVQGS